MSDLIDRNQLDEVCSRLNADGWGITRNEYKLIDRVLFEFPSAEKTGEWQYVDYGGFGNYHCTACGKICICNGDYDYCPNCGARMVE